MPLRYQQCQRRLKPASKRVPVLLFYLTRSVASSPANRSGLFDRTLSKIEAAKSLAAGSSATASGDYDLSRRRVDTRVREMQLAK